MRGSGVAPQQVTRVHVCRVSCVLRCTTGLCKAHRKCVTALTDNGLLHLPGSTEYKYFHYSSPFFRDPPFTIKMPEVHATIEYLENSPLYEREKPYWCLLPPQDGFDPNEQRVDNLEFELRPDITIRDIRDATEDLTLEINGFQVLSHHSKHSAIKTVEDVQAYKAETEAMLRESLNAVFVKCYELRARKNVLFQREQFDINDPLLVEGPARGAHNGIITVYYSPFTSPISLAANFSWQLMQHLVFAAATMQ